MNERTFVVIFIFWAVLTIVTPTLVLLSDSKAYLHSKINESRGTLVKARKVMEKQIRRANSTFVPSGAPAPAPEPEPELRANEWSALTEGFEKR